MTVAPRSLWSGVAMASVGASAFSGKAIIVKLSYRYDVDAVTVIMYRMLFALWMIGGTARALLGIWLLTRSKA